MSLTEMLERMALEAFAAERGLSVEAARPLWEAERETRPAQAHLRSEAEANAEEIERDRAEERGAAEETSLGRQLGLNVRVRPALAMRLSGLTERSDGTGATRASVTHLLILEPFRSGRLVREAWRFLCTPRAVGFHVSVYDIGQPITCGRCLALLQRHGNG